MIFYIMIDGNFTRKYCFVAGGHTTNPPVSITYSIVFYSYIVPIAFVPAALNDIDVFDANICNEHLNASCCEKIWTKSGPDFNNNKVCVMLIVRALYGLKSGGDSCRVMFTENLGKYGRGYTSTAADKDLWIKREVLPDG